MPVAAGELRHKLTLHAREGVRGVGDPAPAIDLDHDIPAKITAVPLQFQMQERLMLGGQSKQTLYSITVRYRDDVATDLVWLEECCNQRVFEILTLIPDDRLIDLEMTCVVGDR